MRQMITIKINNNSNQYKYKWETDVGWSQADVMNDTPGLKMLIKWQIKLTSLQATVNIIMLVTEYHCAVNQRILK